MTLKTPTRSVPRWRPRSLRRQLVLGVSAVVTVVMLAVGTVSVMTLRSSVTAISDTELSRSLTAFQQSFDEYGDADAAAAHPMTEFMGQAHGNLIAVLRDGAVVNSAVFSDDEARAAPDDVVAAIDAESWKDGAPRTVRLASLGSYRIQSRALDGGDRLIAGVSLAADNRVVASKTIATVSLVALALLATAVGTIVVVGYFLRPLRRVAETAAKVATLPLAGEEDRITARVGEEDTDPDNEIGVVGETLNRLLANVDGALAARAESDRRKRRFLTDASHELRTPLAAILGYAELTRQDSADLPATTEYALARIETEARRMTGLVGDLLLLSRLDEGQDIQTEDVDLCDLVVDAVNDGAVSGSAHSWLTNLPDEPVWVHGDRARLHQLVSNLLSNARVHTSPGTVVTTGITPRPDVDGGCVELTVTNDGPDIDADLLPHLFERFVRADKSRSREMGSTGLGLAIVAAIVEAHHGSVEAESAGGRTVFRVRLPMIEQPAVNPVGNIV